MNCPECKATVPDESRFCPECGKALLTRDESKVADDKAGEKPATDSKDAKKGCLGCLGFIVIALIFVALLGSLGGDKSVPADIKTGSLADYGQWLITDVVGTKGADDHETIQNITGANGVLFATAVSKDFLSAKTALSTIQMHSKEIFERAYTDREDIQQVSINWQLPLVDNYGNSSLGTVVKVALNKDTADRVNWDGVSFQNIDRWADVWWTHPAVAE